MKINSDMAYLLVALLISGALFAITREKELMPIVAGCAGALGAIAQGDARSKESSAPGQSLSASTTLGQTTVVDQQQGKPEQRG